MCAAVSILLIVELSAIRTEERDCALRRSAGVIRAVWATESRTRLQSQSTKDRYDAGRSCDAMIYSQIIVSTMCVTLALGTA